MNLENNQIPSTEEQVSSSEHLSANPPSDTELKEERIRAFNERRQGRVDRLRERADRKKSEGSAFLNRAESIASHIPPGQPILVGHHSEKRHRKDLDRVNNATSKGVSACDAAQKLGERAEAAENNRAIFTEDPEAKEKLEKRISELTKMHGQMKEINKRMRNGKSLAEFGMTKAQEEALRTPDFLGRTGIADYALKNNSANIRRLKIRLAALKRQEKLPEPEDVERNGIRIVENLELNRIQIFFPTKPDEKVRDQLKGNGFRWSPFNGCWLRHRSAYATTLAHQFLGEPA